MSNADNRQVKFECSQCRQLFLPNYNNDLLSVGKKIFCTTDCRKDYYADDQANLPLGYFNGKLIRRKA